jgi:hypothetical protein
MVIGHVCLERSMNDIGEHFVKLVEGLDRQGVRQHVIVANSSLARRVAICENVRVGPVVRTSLMACCLMPDVTVAHMHDAKSNQAGLILHLTRSIPYVLTRRSVDSPTRNPVSRSMLERAASVICPTNDSAKSLLDYGVSNPVDVVEDISFNSEEDEDSAANRIAAEHQRIYRRAIDTRRVPALLL